MKTLKSLAAKATAFARAYPARTVSIVVAVVVFVAAKVGVVVDQQSLGTALAYAIPILVGGEVTHRNVTPA